MRSRPLSPRSARPYRGQPRGRPAPTRRHGSDRYRRGYPGCTCPHDTVDARHGRAAHQHLTARTSPAGPVRHHGAARRPGLREGAARSGWHVSFLLFAAHGRVVSSAVAACSGRRTSRHCQGFLSRASWRHASAAGSVTAGAVGDVARVARLGGFRVREVDLDGHVRGRCRKTRW